MLRKKIGAIFIEPRCKIVSAQIGSGQEFLGRDALPKECSDVTGRGALGPNAQIRALRIGQGRPTRRLL